MVCGQQKNVAARKLQSRFICVCEVHLPQLINPSHHIFELTGSFDHNEGRAGDQVMQLQCQAYDTK